MVGSSHTEWVLHIGELLRRDDLQTALQIPTSIFKLSDTLTKHNPQAYSPSQVLLGPYQHSKPQLHKMEIFKLHNANKSKDEFQLPEFTQIVDKLNESEIQIRSSYDQNLEIHPESLAWRLLIDGLFFLRLLGISDNVKETRGNNSDYRFNLILPNYFEENKIMNHNEVVRDLLKLENQIPIHILKNIVPSNLSNNLGRQFFKFCVSVSPLPLPPYDDEEFQLYIRSSPDVVDQYQHLLHSSRPCPDLSEVLDQSQHLLHFLYALIFYERFAGFAGGAVSRRGASLFLELLNMMAKIIKVAFLQQLLEAVGLIQTLLGLLLRVRQLSPAGGDGGSSPPLPSASELKKVGVKFDCKTSGYKSSGFDKATATLKLPIITINAFSEVILRNLVAFEAAAEMNPPWISHFVRLMSGLMVTGEDVGILKRGGVVKVHSGDDEDVVKLFKELGNLPDRRNESDQAAGDLNKVITWEVDAIGEMKQYYESWWKVKVERFAKRYFCPVFQALMILFIVLLIAVVAVRMVCGWFTCPKLFGHSFSVVSKAENYW